jgi:tetratricopeptide (TPR) repeat protein
LDLIPAHPVYLTNRSLVQFASGRIAASLADADAALAGDNTWVKAHYRRARALLSLGRHDEAIEAFDTLLKIDPDHVDAAVFRRRAVDARTAKLSARKTSLAAAILSPTPAVVSVVSVSIAEEDEPPAPKKMFSEPIPVAAAAPTVAAPAVAPTLSADEDQETEDGWIAVAKPHLADEPVAELPSPPLKSIAIEPVPAATSATRARVVTPTSKVVALRRSRALARMQTLEMTMNSIALQMQDLHRDYEALCQEAKTRRAKPIESQ